MGIIKTKGIVIKECASGDFDKVITILTPDLGQVTCFAKSARKPKSTLLAGTSLFAFSDIMLFKGTNTYTINSCNTIEVFYNLRIDLDKLNYAIYITKIIQDVTYENEQSFKILQLYLNTLYMLSETDKNPEFIISVFKFRLTSILGFTPMLNKCCSCGDNHNLTSFSFRDNGIKCTNCARQDTGAIKITESTHCALKYIISSNAKQIFNFELKEDSQKELEIVSKIYLNEKLEKEYCITGACFLETYY